MRSDARAFVSLSRALHALASVALLSRGVSATHAASASAVPAAHATSSLVETAPGEVSRTSDDGELSRAARRLIEITAARTNDVAWIELDLASLGRDALATLVDAGAEGVVRIPRAGREPLELPLTTAIATALPGALARSSGTAVVRELERLARSAPTERARVFALDVLARCGATRDLELAQRLASDGAAPALADAFERALGGILARAPTARAKLADLHATLPPTLTQALARAVTRLPTSEALALLAHFVHARRGDETALLAEIARLGRGSDACDTDDVRAAVRTLVADSDARIAAAAARAACALGDVDGVTEIAGMLGSFERSARDAAREALVELVGCDLGRDARAWRAWHATESRWWQIDAAAAETDLVRGDAVAAVDAVRALARRSAFPHEASRLVELGLARAEPEIAALACAALGSMRCERARLALEGALERAEPVVQETARAALAVQRARALD